MIRYQLKCADGHQFESWFQSSDAFDRLQSAGRVECAICGNAQVERSLMAPSVSPARGKAREPSLSQPATDTEKALAAMRKHVEDNSDFVGLSFASEARKIHDGDAPERAIYGEAKPEEAKKLIEDGVPVAPLPFMPKRKAN
ncbi:MAG: DUF1178 family protein [Pseudomonadota bacterium]